MSGEQVKQGYKRSEVGVIPDEWEVKAFGDCLLGRPRYGINAPAVPFSDRLPAYIRITDITEDGRIGAEKPVSVNSAFAGNYYLNDGDIVFARTGASVGKSYRYVSNDGPLVFAGCLIQARPNPEVLLSAYAAAYVTTGTYWNWVRLMSMRSGQPGINGNEFAKLPVPIPLVAEQHAIATALADVDALLAKLDQLIAKKRELKQATMQQLLTGQTRLPGFSGDWEVKRLGEVASLKNGYTFKSETYSPLGCFKVITIANVQDGFMVLDDCNSVDKTPPDIQPHQLLKIGDILISMTGNVGRICRVSVDSCLLNQRVGKLVPTLVQDDFLFALLRQPSFIVAMSAAAKGGAQPNLSATDIGGYEFSIPVDAAEQTAIAKVLSDMDSELATLEARRDKTRALKHGMMQELLTGRIRLI